MRFNLLKYLTELFDSIKYYLIKDNPQVVEWLTIGPQIESLAKEVLDAKEFNQARSLSKCIIIGGRQRKIAINFLCRYVGYKPKRPLYYVSQDSLRCLPKRTRDVVRYLGDYIDVLVKCIAKEKAVKPFFTPRSLSINLRYLKESLPQDLYSQLERYDNNIYRPAKHEFDTGERKHRFTVTEAIFTVFITINLAKKLIHISPLAQKYSDDNNPNIWIEMVF